jgi:hypothetical protein
MVHYYLDEQMILFHIDKSEWIWKDSISRPTPRFGHSACLLDGHRDPRMIVFGGMSERTSTNDLYEYRTTNSTWKKIEPNNTPPGKRYFHSSVLAEEILYIFGGITVNNIFNDLWSFNFATNLWNHFITDKVFTSNTPTLFYENQLWMLGNGPCAFHLKTHELVRLDVVNNPPFFTTSIQLFQGKVYFFGGIEGSNLGYIDFDWKPKMNILEALETRIYCDVLFVTTEDPDFNKY